MQFFRSLLPILTPLSMFQKLKVRMAIMNLLLPYTVSQNILTLNPSDAFVQPTPQFSRHDSQKQYPYTTSQPQVANFRHYNNTLSQPTSLLTQLTPQYHRTLQTVTTRSSPPTLSQLEHHQLLLVERSSIRKNIEELIALTITIHWCLQTVMNPSCQWLHCSAKVIFEMMTLVLSNSTSER